MGLQGLWCLKQSHRLSLIKGQRKWNLANTKSKYNLGVDRETMKIKNKEYVYSLPFIATELYIGGHCGAVLKLGLCSTTLPSPPVLKGTSISSFTAQTHRTTATEKQTLAAALPPPPTVKAGKSRTQRNEETCHPRINEQVQARTQGSCQPHLSMISTFSTRPFSSGRGGGVGSSRQRQVKMENGDLHCPRA